MHPATKKQHMIDFVIMKAKQCMFCTDVKVMRQANCWTDHQMVRAKLRLRAISQKTKRNLVKPFVTHRLYNLAVRDEYKRI